MSKSINNYQIGEINVRRIGYGGMQLTGTGVWGDASDRPAAINLLKQSLDEGVNFIDTADSYGPHTNEILIADALYPYPKDLIIATKGGFERTGPGQWVINGRPDYIKKMIDGSLKRLKLERIDLWQLHRIDPKIPLEETLGPVHDAMNAGKIRYVGLSEVSIADIEAAEKVIPISSVQNHYNLVERKWEALVDYTAKRKMAFIPWYPLASGPSKLVDKIAGLAKKYNATPAQIALAWLLKRSPNVLLIPCTSSRSHLSENMKAGTIQLTDEDFNLLSAGN